MIDYDLQLKVQAYLDGELPEPEAALMETCLAENREACALLQELRNTHEALCGSETGICLPESREFFWSKIERKIRAAEPSSAARPRRSWLARLQQYLVPASAVGLLGLVLVLSIGRSSAVQPGEMELVSDEMGALTFRSQSEQMTMVWLYPRTDTQVARDTLPIDLDPE